MSRIYIRKASNGYQAHRGKGGKCMGWGSRPELARADLKKQEKMAGTSIPNYPDDADKIAISLEQWNALNDANDKLGQLRGVIFSQKYLLVDAIQALSVGKTDVVRDHLERFRDNLMAGYIKSHM